MNTVRSDPRKVSAITTLFVARQGLECDEQTEGSCKTRRERVVGKERVEKEGRASSPPSGVGEKGRAKPLLQAFAGR